MRPIALLVATLLPLALTAPARAKKPASLPPAALSEVYGPPLPSTLTRAVGRPWDGELVAGSRLPDEGEGYEIPAPWQKRGLNFGTPELVGAIMRAAAVVVQKRPGGRLCVADLSREHGGATTHHRSHQNGLDADLIFYALDEDGAPAATPAGMRRFDKHLRAGKYRFDLERNWLLLRTLITDDSIRVEHVFVAPHLEKALLAHAVRKREPMWLIALADAKMSLSGGAHDDHFHVRIGCPRGDDRCGEVLAQKPGKKAKGGKKVAARGGKQKGQKHGAAPRPRHGKRRAGR